MSMSTDLSVYDQKNCHKTITKLVTKTKLLKLTASPLVFTFYPDSQGELLPAKERTFDYEFICSATHLITITLSSADDWSVLNCVKNKHQIRAINLEGFDHNPLDIRLLLQFANLESLFLSSGEMINIPELAHLTSLNFLSLNGLNMTAKDLGYVAQLTNLDTLQIERLPRVEVSYLASLNKLETLELVNIPAKGINLAGLEAFPKLIELNLQGSHITDTTLNDIGPLNQLRRLNLADNIGITTVAH